MSARKINLNQTYQLGIPTDISDPIAAGEEQAASGNYQYLLAYADDGIIWGVIQDKKLKLSSQIFPEISPLFRLNTLRELRLFGAKTEWFAWRTENDSKEENENKKDKWKARMITDGVGESVDCFDEKLILWGTENEGDAQDGFQVVRESDLGIRHTPPLSLKGRHNAKLVVRHYLDYDFAGVVYIKLSRLVTLENGESA